MRKLFISFVLLAVGLLVGTNAWAQNVAKIVETDTEYATFAAAVNAVKADQTIRLLDDASYTPTNTYQYWGVDKNLTLDLDEYTLTLNAGSYYGVYVYSAAQFHLTSAIDSQTHKSLGTLIIPGNKAAQAFEIEDANSRVIVDNVTIQTGWSYILAASCYNNSYGFGNITLGENVTFDKTGTNPQNKKDIYVSSYANSNVTINGDYDGLYIDVASQTNNATIINNGTLTNVKLHESTDDSPTYSGTGTYELTVGSSVCQNTRTSLGDKLTLAEGCCWAPYDEDWRTYDVVEANFMVGSTGYLDLNEALAASSESTPAKMKHDLSNTAALNVTNAGYLDLNGYNYKLSENGIVVNCDITIIDSSEGHTGRMYNEDAGYYLFQNCVNNTTIKLLGGTFQELGAMDGNWESYAVTAKSQATYTLIVDGPHTKIEVPYGTGVAVYGKYESSTVTVRNGASITAGNFCIANLGTYTDMNTTMNIESGAKLTSTTAAAIYHPGGGYLNISGENTSITGAETAVEIRAGELNINGGSLTSTYNSFVCDRNGSGTTTKGAALAIAQHTTKQPITVNISGGHFRGNYAVSQCNPQQNPDEYLDLLNIEVTGGYFWSTNGANIISVTENRRLFLKGGVYNLDPAAFTVNGYFSLPNQPELYAGSYAQGYVFKVAQQDITETETKGTETTDWAQNTTWTTDLVPDYATNVTVGKDIVVTTPAEANKVTIQEGKTLTIKNGGTLIIGNGGIIGATAQTFKVENGGQVLIAPNAENATLRGSVDLLADRAGLKPGVSYTGQGSEMYWQHIAIPTQGAPESITPSVKGKTFFNTWDIMKGWQNVGTTALNQSFKGYNLGNFHPYSADGSASVVYTFVGDLVGNQPDYMVFAREGHSFFGNSYLAPLDIATMLNTLYQSDLEYTINVYDSQNEIYAPVNDATGALLGITEIKPLQGFFIYAQNATQAQLDYNSAVYTAYLNKHAAGGQTAAPARQVAKTNTYDKMAQITIAAATGEKDAIYLFEAANFSDAEDNGFDARNLEHNGLDMSIFGSYADLSVLATDNLEGALLNVNTNNAVEYTMTFSHIQGNMTLTDNVTGAVIAMQEGATYTFAAQPNAQLNGRFAINAVRTMPTNNESITINPAAKGVYTMMGQYVGETANWNALPAGVYVVDGVRVSK